MNPLLERLNQYAEDLGAKVTPLDGEILASVVFSREIKTMVVLEVYPDSTYHVAFAFAEFNSGISASGIFSSFAAAHQFILLARLHER